jgi:hypothetical protein
VTDTVFELRKGWRVLDTCGKYGDLSKAEPRAFHLTYIRIQVDQWPFWMVKPSDLFTIPTEYHNPHKWIAGRLNDWGFNTEQEAWSDYMRGWEHEIGVVKSSQSIRLHKLQILANFARAEWMRAQKEPPIPGLIPPVQYRTGE